MAGPWVQDAVLFAEFAGLLGKAPADLPAHWAPIVSEANRQAAVDIAAAVFGRGYSAAQLDAADNRVRWNKMLGKYYSLVETGAGAEYDADFINRFDVRPELEKLTVLMVAGSPVAPASPADTDVGGISYGTSTTRRDELEREARCKGWFS